MNCPRCQSPLEDASAKFCPLCGASVTAPPPPQPEPGPGLGGPTWRPEPVIAEPQVQAQAQPSSPEPPQSSAAHCALHSDRAAVDICSRCGAFACRECLVIGADGQGVCSACLARQGGETGPLPWERRAELGFFKAYWETAKSVMFNPNTAFDRVQPETGKWWDPLSFSILSTFLGASGFMVFYGLFGAFGAFTALMGGSGKDLSGALVAGIVLAVILAVLVLIPLSAVMTVFVGAGIEHLTLRLVGVQVRPFEATVRAYCYAQAPMFWGLVPVCGYYAFMVWVIVCRIFGYKAIHRTTGGKASAGVLVPMGVCCGVTGLFYAIAFAASFAGKH
ncbi:MAG TPA: YIP1 family protein [Myxococcales bacterium]|jgi:hypothetical protein